MLPMPSLISFSCPTMLLRDIAAYGEFLSPSPKETASAPWQDPP
jgi:hypothetical protein